MAVAAPTPGGVVFAVQRCSFHDGPGVRTTVFLKGCPLRCPWCHNPEGIAAEPEVLVNQARCLACHACEAACPRPGGPLPGGARLGEDGCTACRRCVAACPSGAREVAGRVWDVDEVLAEVLRDRAAMEESGGGVTFSGGEPLAQPAFLLACLAACRREGVHTAVDTCGLAPREVVGRLAGLADLVLFDIKLLDPARHRELLQVSLEPVLSSLAVLSGASVPLWLRLPVVPGVNDDAAHLEAVARLAASLPSLQRASLLPYHRTGTGKLERLRREDPFPAASPPAPEVVQAMAARLEAAGIPVVVGG